MAMGLDIADLYGMRDMSARKEDLDVGACGLPAGASLCDRVSMGRSYGRQESLTWALLWEGLDMGGPGYRGLHIGKFSTLRRIQNLFPI